jgi:pentapeptide MXKDX repeat protein
MNGE